MGRLATLTLAGLVMLASAAFAVRPPGVVTTPSLAPDPDGQLYCVEHGFGSMDAGAVVGTVTVP